MTEKSGIRGKYYLLGLWHYSGTSTRHKANISVRRTVILSTERFPGQNSYKAVAIMRKALKQTLRKAYTFFRNKIKFPFKLTLSNVGRDKNKILIFIGLFSLFLFHIFFMNVGWKRLKTYWSRYEIISFHQFIVDNIF